MERQRHKFHNHCFPFKIGLIDIKTSEIQIRRRGVANDMAIRNKNLNLIPLLQALLKNESVARASEEIGLSQPAMSGSLARLRELLDDDILVRVGRSMRLTPRALNLRNQVDQVCAQIEQLFQAELFDPSTAKRSFSIAAPDYIAFLLTDALLERLAREAPGIEIHFIDVPPNDIVNDMETAKIDLLVCADFGLWPDLPKSFLFRERYVVAGAEGHPLLEKENVSIADLAEYPSPSVNYASTLHTPESRRWMSGIPAVDLASQISSMNQFNAILLAIQPRAIARTPATLAWRLRDALPLKIIELAEQNTAFDTCMFWVATTERAHEHRWLRSIVKDALAPYNDIGKLTNTAPAH
jgi:DNA-binding transcriptional LysR family regulator